MSESTVSVPIATHVTIIGENMPGGLSGEVTSTALQAASMKKENHCAAGT